MHFLFRHIFSLLVDAVDSPLSVKAASAALEFKDFLQFCFTECKRLGRAFLVVLSD